MTGRGNQCTSSGHNLAKSVKANHRPNGPRSLEPDASNLGNIRNRCKPAARLASDNNPFSQPRANVRQQGQLRLTGGVNKHPDIKRRCRHTPPSTSGRTKNRRGRRTGEQHRAKEQRHSRSQRRSRHAQFYAPHPRWPNLRTAKIPKRRHADRPQRGAAARHEPSGLLTRNPAPPASGHSAGTDAVVESESTNRCAVALSGSIEIAARALARASTVLPAFI